jgi:medium-chain acyl-[acyl-carrier-protein] hydrolase
MSAGTPGTVPGKPESAESLRWLSASVPTKPNATTRLWCFPFAGGGASAYHPWRKLAPEWMAIEPVLLPGRERRISETAFNQIDTLIERMVHALGPAMRPEVALFGYSMGALIAFEFARALRRHGYTQPRQLIVAAHRPPQLPDPFPPIYHLPAEELKTRLKERFGEYNEGLNHPELCDLLLPCLRADLQLCAEYRYRDEPPLDCRISVLGAVDDLVVDPNTISAWGEQSSQPVTLKLFEGGHFFMQVHSQDVMNWVTQQSEGSAEAISKR